MADESTSVKKSESLLDKEMIRKLNNGFIVMYQQKLNEGKYQLDELTKKQVSLVSQLQEENEKLNNIQSFTHLQEMFLILKEYQSKLAAVKKEMTQLHERSTKLKKRALKVQQFKQKEALQRQAQIQKEQDLIAKPNLTNRN